MKFISQKISQFKHKNYTKLVLYPERLWSTQMIFIRVGLKKENNLKVKK